MLLAAEGGGFFSSSASGYSKGLALIFFRKKPKENPMRISPWNQYQLVVSDPDIQLDSEKSRLSRGCATFLCFGRASAGLERPSSLKVGPAQPQVILTEPSVSDKGVDLDCSVIQIVFHTLQGDCPVSLNTVDSLDTLIADIKSRRWDAIFASSGAA